MENETLRSMMRHRSIRAYQVRAVDDKTVSEIVEAVQAAPTWVNLQHVSIIAVKKPRRREKMAQLCGEQLQIAQAPVFLVFCADFYKTQLAMGMHDESIADAMRDPDMLLVAAHEVGIAVGTAVVAAESLGLGTCVVGDVRLHPREIVKMLHLPKYVFPMLGLCLGYAAETPGLKPRLPRRTVFFQEEYRSGELPDDLIEYDAVYTSYLRKRPWNNRVGTWTELVADFYRPPYSHYPDVPAILHEQGFSALDERKREQQT